MPLSGPAAPLLSFAVTILVAAGLVSAISIGIGRTARPWIAGPNAGRRGKLVLVGARVAYLAVVLLGFLGIVAYGLHILDLGNDPALDATTKLIGFSLGLLLATLAAQAGFRKGLGR